MELPCIRTVLIVEDDPVIRDTLAAVITYEGFEPILACNGEEALNHLRGRKKPEPCLILLDMLMPGMNGWDFIKAARLSGDTVAQIPVIAITASSARTPEGVTKVLRKPVDLEDLLEEISKHCGLDEVSESPSMH